MVYQATVTTEGGNVEIYVGLTKNPFKVRYKAHKKSIKHEKFSTETALSGYLWELKRKNINYDIKWQVVDRAPPFSPVTGVCKLCTLEKYYILFIPERASLNKNDEVFKPCRHKPLVLLNNT